MSNLCVIVDIRTVRTEKLAGCLAAINVINPTVTVRPVSLYKYKVILKKSIL